MASVITPLLALRSSSTISISVTTTAMPMKVSPPSAAICRRALGSPRHPRHLVGQLAPNLHVFQSLLVSRTFLFRCGSFPLVLAGNGLLPIARAMGDSRFNHRSHAQRLLPQCYGSRRPRDRSPSPVLPCAAPRFFLAARIHSACS